MSALLGPTEIQHYIADLGVRVPTIRSIWLIGSRAAGTATSTSDWDFLVFGSPGTGEAIGAHPELKREGVDVFVNDEDGDFRAPWPGSDRVLEHIHWKQVSATEAIYMASKSKREPDGTKSFYADIRQGTSLRVWPQP